MKKYLKLLGHFAAAPSVAAAIATLFPEVRTWASQEGSYIYHQLFIKGPVETFVDVTYQTFTTQVSSSTVGVQISSGSFPGGGGATPLIFVGALTTGQIKTTAGIQGEVALNITTFALCTGTGTTAANAVAAWVYLSSAPFAGAGTPNGFNLTPCY